MFNSSHQPSMRYRANDLKSTLQTVREIAMEVVAPNAERVDAEKSWPEENIRTLQKEGLAGFTVPMEFEGHGQGAFGIMQLCEILGQECASTAMCFGMHLVGTAVMSAKARPDQCERYLEPIVNGQHLTTLSLSETGTGSHFYIPQTRLVASDNGKYFTVSGEKTFVTNGGFADSYVLSTVAADADSPLGQFSCVTIDRDCDGLTWGEPWDGLGMHGNSSRKLTLDNVRIPRNNLLGEEGDQIWYVFQVVAPYFLMAMAGTYLGIAGAALEEGRRHLIQRYYNQSGSKLAQLPVIQHRLGCLWGELERTRHLSYHAATAFDNGDPDALPAVFTAKAEVAECCVNMVNEVMTLMGGIGYRENSIMHRLLRDARAAHVMAPTTDMLRIWTGRALLGQPILSD